MVLLIVGVLAFMAVRALRHGHLRWLLAVFAAYGAAGWVYFWVVPVPTPQFPHGKWIHDTEARELYFKAFTRGYQEGVTDSYINEDFVPEAYSRGKGDGLVAGIGERIRVAPRVMRSGLVEHLRKYPPTPEAEQ
ncbi:MAG: hypothetical protein F9K18_00845 [Thermoanaerobaculia bacterium]|nr:MAG: hypothetical protein F9K18_00845 [Thermoanaerobaculia bacterium]